MLGVVTLDGRVIGSVEVTTSDMPPPSAELGASGRSSLLHLASLQSGGEWPGQSTPPMGHRTGRSAGRTSRDTYIAGARDAIHSGPNKTVAQTRAPFGKELEKAEVRERLFRLTEAENPRNPRAFMESVMNRAAARHQTLEEAMNDAKYYPHGSIKGKTPGDRDAMQSAMKDVLGGSNVTNFATGNASLGVGFGYGKGKGDPYTYRDPHSGERYGVENRQSDIEFARRMRGSSEVGGDVKPLQAAPGRHPNLSLVDPRLKEIVSAGGTHLPSGYSVVVNEGYNAHGHVANSQHHVPGRGALDVQIVGPHGPIPNKGADTTGLYTQLARGSYGEMLARHPELKGQFAWGGAFGTSRGSSTPDLMHFDIGGERGDPSRYLTHMGELPDRKYGEKKPEVKVGEGE